MWSYFFYFVYLKRKSRLDCSPTELYFEASLHHPSNVSKVWLDLQRSHVRLISPTCNRVRLRRAFAHAASTLTLSVCLRRAATTRQRTANHCPPRKHPGSEDWRQGPTTWQQTGQILCTLSKKYVATWPLPRSEPSENSSASDAIYWVMRGWQVATSGKERKLKSPATATQTGPDAELQANLPVAEPF